MSTFLFDDIIFGPVNSRRFGVLLGINLLPVGYKFCTFNSCRSFRNSDKNILLIGVNPFEKAEILLIL
jgi:hypothetical protein